MQAAEDAIASSEKEKGVGGGAPLSFHYLLVCFGFKCDFLEVFG